MSELIAELTVTNPWTPGRKVVVVAEFDEEKPLATMGFRPGWVFYCRGISSDHATLEAAGASKAAAVVIAAGRRKLQGHNLRSLFTCAAVKRHRSRKGCPVIAELQFDDNEARFQHAGVTKLVPVRRIADRLMCHACLNPGISDLLMEMLSVRTPQTATIATVGDDPVLKRLAGGKPFKEALLSLRRKDILLLAVYREGAHGHRESEMEFRHDSPYIVNPTSDDASRVISEKDSIIVIRVAQRRARDEQQLLALGHGFRTETAQSFDEGNEHVLVIGGDREAGPFIRIVRDHAKCITHLVPGDSEGTASTVGNVIRFDEVACSPANLERLIDLHEDAFRGVSRVIILSPEHEHVPSSERQALYQDDETMRHAMTIEHVYDIKFGRGLHTVAEIRSTKNLELYRDIGVEQPVPTNRFIERILASMVHYGGLVSEFLLKTMSYESSNERARLVRVSVKKLPPDLRDDVIGSGYDAALAKLIQQGMQLMAIVKANGDIVLNPAGSSAAANEGIGEADSLFMFVRPTERPLRRDHP